MINRPLAYKGPVDHLTNYFSEKVLMAGLSILLEDNLVNWKSVVDEKYIKGTCLCDGQFTKQILDWPLIESVGSCSCNDFVEGDAGFPCDHLAALAIESKTRLHRLPPSTKQQSKHLSGKRYIQRWLSQQAFDPFPAMARHRVIYCLQNNNDQWVVEVFKAYLTKEGKYQIKSPINLKTSIESELFSKKQTKFYCLTDQKILYLLNNEIGSQLITNETSEKHLFEIINNEQGNEIIKALSLTGRLFWQSSHRPPIELTNRNKNFWRGSQSDSNLSNSNQVNSHQTSSNQSDNLRKISENYYLDLKHNSIIEVFEEAAKKSKTLFPQLMNKRVFDIKPVLKITSTEITVPWKKTLVEHFDIAKLSFMVNEQEFSLKSLLPLVVDREARKEFSEKLSEYLLQIENLSVLETKYEAPIIDSFHFGDRKFDSHLSHMLPILNGLNTLGWSIKIEKGFRLNQVSSQEWYVDIRQGYDNKDKQNLFDEKLSDCEEPQQLDLLSGESLKPKQIKSKTNKEFDWFELEVGVKVKGKSINLMPYIVSLIKRGEINFNQTDDDSTIKIKLDSGETLFLKRERVHSIFSSFVELNNEKNLNEEDRLRFSSNQFGRLIPLLEAEKLESGRRTKSQLLDWENGKALATKAKQLSNDKGIRHIDSPSELVGELRDYQQSGLNWLQFLRKHQLGGILADDMGLGKTIQTLAHILVEKKKGRLKTPCLVIAPTSLLSNWEQESRKFAPTLNFMKFSGSNRKSLYSKIPSMDLIVTSYGLILRDINKLRKTRFHLVILDEAQVIKNTRSKITSAVNDLYSNQRLCLTGTPMENHLGELWSLFHFLMPEFLGSEYQFNQLYRQPIEKNQDFLRQTLLAKRVAPLMLRRTKNEVAKELPSKTEMVTLIQLEEAQADLYETIRTSMLDQVTKAMTLETKNRNQFLIGNALLKLRQVCCHSSLIRLDSAQRNHSSAKITWLRERLPLMVNQGRRILLFSSFTSMLDIIADELKELSISYLMLTGKSKHRGKLVEQFQKSEVPVFLISLKAGGVGLNLTAADTVIHYDPWWNPAAEQQANDRAYRIGQDKPVFVYKLITKGTVEEKIQEMQKQKHKLAQGLYEQDAADTMNLTSADWQALFQPIDGF